MAGLISQAKARQRNDVPTNPEDDLFIKDIHSQVKFGYNEQGPYFTTFYLNGNKINELTMPLEACANPQFDGPATLAYKGKSFHVSTVNAMEQDFNYRALVFSACENLTAIR